MSDIQAIWYSRILTDINALVGLDCVMAQDALEDILRYKHRYEAWELDPQGNGPVSLKFRKGTYKIKPTLQDAFKIWNAFLVVSPKLRDVLVRFDLGATRLIEVPVFKSNGKTPADYPPHYVLHVTETKSTLIPEASKDVEQALKPGQVEGYPDGLWRDSNLYDQLAVHAAAADGVDLWADPILQRRLFFSDRLKRAIEEAGIRSRALTFVAAGVIP